MTTSICFEELAIGRQFKTAMSAPISSEMIDAYFALTGDRFNIHRDDDFARRFGLNAAMVPGNLVVAIATGLVYEAGYFTDTLVVQARKDTVFKQPLYVNECIQVAENVVALEDRPEKLYGRVLLERLVLNEKDQVIQKVAQDYRITKRTAMLELGSLELVRQTKP